MSERDKLIGTLIKIPKYSKQAVDKLSDSKIEKIFVDAEFAFNDELDDEGITNQAVELEKKYLPTLYKHDFEEMKKIEMREALIEYPKYNIAQLVRMTIPELKEKVRLEKPMSTPKKQLVSASIEGTSEPGISNKRKRLVSASIEGPSSAPKTISKDHESMPIFSQIINLQIPLLKAQQEREMKEAEKPVKEKPTPKVEKKPEPKPEPKEEKKPEAKPEPKPEPKEEKKPEEPKPEKKPEEPKPEKKPEPKPEPKEEKKPEAKPEPKPEPKEEKKPEEPKPEKKPEPKPAAEKTGEISKSTQTVYTQRINKLKKETGADVTDTKKMTEFIEAMNAVSGTKKNYYVALHSVTKGTPAGKYYSEQIMKFKS